MLIERILLYHSEGLMFLILLILFLIVVPIYRLIRRNEERIRERGGHVPTAGEAVRNTVRGTILLIKWGSIVLVLWMIFLLFLGFTGNLGMVERFFD